MTTVVIPGVTAAPKLRHSARSRGIHLRLPTHLPKNPVPSAHPDGYCDFAQYDGRRHSRGSCVLQTGSNRRHKLHHSRSNRRTQTSSFRAQSRNPSPLANAPAWNPVPSAHPDGYCDFAQYDGRRHSRSSRVLQTGSNRHHKLRHSRSNRRTQTSSFRAQSRNPSPLANAPAWNPVPSAHPDGYCDFAQYDGRRHSRSSRVLQTGSNCRHKLRHSRSNRRTQTSSFRAQSRNPSPLANAPAWNPVPSAHPDGYCDFAQYDGRRHSRGSCVLQTGSNRHHKLHHSRSNRRTQTSSFRAQSRNPSPLANAPTQKSSALGAPRWILRLRAV